MIGAAGDVDDGVELGVEAGGGLSFDQASVLGGGFTRGDGCALGAEGGGFVFVEAEDTGVVLVESVSECERVG